jgi:uncharacterized protein YndB with AHSA1/START domain
MTWYPLEPCDESFFETAPFVYRYPVALPVPPDQVWSSLTSDRSMADWGLPLRKLEWTSPRPFGIGTTREVAVSGNLFAFQEYFFRWEEGHRFSFYATAVNRRLLRRFAEDYLVEDAPSGSRFTWTIAYEPTARSSALVRLTGPVNALGYRAVPLRARKYFATRP